MQIRIGTSGWVYQHWRGLFYPDRLRQSNWFADYAQVFDTVEINNSFYRLPSAAAFTAWRQQAPPDFVYAVKASRFLTHMKKLRDPGEPLERFFERVRCLGPTLGPVLYQLPPHWQVNLPRFEAFLAALPPGYAHVVEFRDASWLIEAVFELMERYGVAHCIHDMQPLTIPARVTAPPVYVRFHGDAAHGGDYQEAARTQGLRARLLVPLTRAPGGASLHYEIELDHLDQFDDFRSSGLGSAEATGDWMRELSEVLTAPPVVEISRVADQA